MTSSKPATEKEMIAALNARVNKLEKRMTAPAPAVSIPDLEARITAMETRMNNTINELEAKAERAIASVALLIRKDT